MSAKYKSPSFLLPNELNTSSNPANDTGVNSLYSMDFDGSGYISVNPIVLTDFSVSFWINPSTITGASYDGILGQGTTAAQGGILRYVAYDGNTSTGSVILYLGSSWTNVASLTNGVWSNVILTYDSTADELKSYKNGSLDTTISSPDFSGQTTNAHSFVDIGRRNGSSGSIFNGQIDEVAIFNKALNTTEIAALYEGSGSNIYPSNLMAANLNPIAYYPLGEQAQNTGYLDPNNPGSDMSGSEWQFPNGVLQDYVMDFDGGDNIIVGKKFDFVQSTNVFTINLWIKSSNFNHNSNQVILGTNNTSSNNQVGFQLWNDDRGGGNGNQALNFNIFNGSSGTAIAVNTALTDNNWHMITVVGTGSSINMYKDGNTTPIGSSSSATTSTTAQSNLLIGTNILSSLGFIGKISNLAIWNTDQSTNVANIYNNGSPQTSYTVTPQNWWKLNADSVYTPSVASYSTALDFNNASSDYISFPDISFTGEFTLSFWMKPNSTGIGVVVGDDNSTNWLRINNLTTTDLDLANSKSSWQSGVTFTTGEWQHVVLRRDSSNVCTIFRNGIHYTNNSPTKTGTFGPLNKIGQKNNGGYFNGQLSNIAIFNSSLTSSQVSTLFNFGTPETNISFNPVNWWKLDNLTTGIQDSGSASNNGTNNGATQATTSVAVVPSWKIPDASGASNGVSTTLPSTALQQSDLQFDSPYSNYSLSFDGTGDYIRTSGFTIGNNYTFSCWLKSDTTTPNFMCFLSSPNYYTNNYNGNFVIRFTSSTQIQMYSYNGQADSESSTVTIPSIDNNWHHFSLTSNGTTTKIYWDGSPLTVTGNQTKSLDNISQGLIIGHNITGFNNAFNGKIDETSIFNYSLSEAQVLEIYNNGRPNDLSTFSGTAPISWWRLGENAYFDNNSFVVPNSITGAPNGTGFGTITTMISADAPGTYANGIGENLDILDRVGNAPLSTSNSQSYNMIPSDISPYVPAYVGNQIANNFSMSFDGVNDYITVPDSSDLQLVNTDFSISFWINPSAVGSYLFMKKYGSGTGWGIWLESGNLRFLAFPSGFQTVTTVSQNVWTHILIVGDNSGNNLLCYKNGAEVYNSSYTLSISSNTTDLEIGSAHGVAYFYKGLIDEVAIFDKALTADQVKFDLYKPSLPAGSNKTADFVNNPNLPNPVAWYRMGD